MTKTGLTKRNGRRTSAGEDCNDDVNRASQNGRGGTARGRGMRGVRQVRAGRGGGEAAGFAGRGGREGRVGGSLRMADTESDGEGGRKLERREGGHGTDGNTMANRGMRRGRGKRGGKVREGNAGSYQNVDVPDDVRSPYRTGIPSKTVGTSPTKHMVSGTSRESEEGGDREAEREIYEMKRKLVAADEERNELRKKLKKAEESVLDKNTEISALAFQIQRLEELKKSLQSENKSLASVKIQMRIVPGISPRKTLNGRAKLVDAIGAKYLGICIELEIKCEGWLMKELYEVELFHDELHRRWDGSCISVESRGVMSSLGKKIVPYLPQKLAMDGKFYTPSEMFITSLIRKMVENILQDGKWASLGQPEQVREDTIMKISECGIIQQRVQVRLSELSTYRKRITRDTLFGALKYDKLVTKCAIKTDEDKLEKGKQVQALKQRLLRRRGDGQYDMSWWRRCKEPKNLEMTEEDCGVSETESVNLCRSAQGSDDGSQIVSNESEMVDDVPLDEWADGEDGDADEAKFGLFRNHASKAVWEAYMRNFLTNVNEGRLQMERNVRVDCSLITLARLDAWMMTVIDCLDMSIKRGGGRQKEYMEKFEIFLPIAVEQLMGDLYDYVQHWEGNDLNVHLHDMESDDEVDDDCGTAEKKKEAVFKKTYAAIVPVEEPNSSEIYAVIQKEWFHC